MPGSIRSLRVVAKQIYNRKCILHVFEESEVMRALELGEVLHLKINVIFLYTEMKMRDFTPWCQCFLLPFSLLLLLLLVLLLLLP